MSSTSSSEQGFSISPKKNMKPKVIWNLCNVSVWNKEAWTLERCPCWVFLQHLVRRWWWRHLCWASQWSPSWLVLCPACCSSALWTCSWCHHYGRRWPRSVPSSHRPRTQHRGTAPLVLKQKKTFHPRKSKPETEATCATSGINVVHTVRNGVVDEDRGLAWLPKDAIHRHA